ncbi:hypothetical protein [Winogradskyella vincentii]|uniref:Outer membrane protein beta-barrel domain-containing protein n=1 Tax=Winogradskyella vincentii TaxID=2877122 RepID=A0ABS7Y012_9FLAO|nr:hypothetical protein [Winogradskyella vincentii]MCA0152083.1 hypothetical protein [Winogradskyella vincentii]
MRKILFLLLFLLAFQYNYSQNTFTIKGQQLELKTEIDGKLDLLWNTFNGEYRYFVRTEDGQIQELKNTKGTDNKFQEEYKSLLSKLTNGQPTEKLRLTVFDLKKFLDNYNASVDSSYTSVQKESKVKFRLGFSGGVTNNPFVGNPENKIAPLIGAELEVFEENSLPRHSGFLQARHAFESDEFQYNATEFSLGYRYRFLNKSTFSIYGQVKVATINFTNATAIGSNNSELDINETAFDLPLIFGIGSDIKVGENSFISIIYGELFAAFLDNQGNFSTDISVGYKFNL